MNDIQIFSNDTFGEIRTITTDDGQILFVGKDVARALGYSNTRDAILRHVADDDKRHGVAFHDPMGRERKPLLINESGLYSLILSSKLESAQEFKHWVTAVVLPQIRQTGGYIPLDGTSADSAQATSADSAQDENGAGAGLATSTGSAQADDEATIMARALLIAQNTIKMKDALLGAVRQQREVERPLVEFAQMVQESGDSCTIAELAKMITSNGHDIGQNRMFDWMRRNHYLGSAKHHRNVAYQCWVESGLFELRYSEPWHDEFGNSHYKVTTLVTPKGQQYFLEKLRA